MRTVREKHRLVPKVGNLRKKGGLGPGLPKAFFDLAERLSVSLWLKAVSRSICADGLVANILVRVSLSGERVTQMWIKKPVAHNLLRIAQTDDEKKILFCLLWYLLLGVRTFRRGRYYQNDNNVIETVLRLCTQSSRWVLRGESHRLLLSNTEQKFTSFSQQCAQRQAFLCWICKD